MNDEEKRIEWDVPQPTLKEWLLVSRRVDGEPSLREHVDATIDDLKRACEAVGLHVVTQEENTERATQARLMASAHDAACSEFKASETELAIVRAGYAKACARVEEALAEVATLRIKLETAHAEVYATRDRNEWKRLYDEEVGRNITLRAQLDELRAEHKATLPASLRELEVLRAQLAAAEALLEATRQASQCAPKSADIPKMVADIVANRKAVCEHARALEAQLAVLTSSEGRATDEDLVEIWANAFDKEQSLATHVPGSGTARLAAARAVAAKVRRERPACLVERLVAEKAKFSAFERESDATWTVHVCLPGTGGYTTNVTDLRAADVPATLARLAGLEVK